MTITRSAWRDQARQDYDLFNETAMVLTSTDQALLEVCEELPADVLQGFADDVAAVANRYACLTTLLAMAQARIRPLLDAALDGRLELSRRARVVREAERNRASMERLRAMLGHMPKAA